MKLALNRSKPRDKAMLGVLFVDSVYECMTLEDISRPDPNPLTPANEAKVMHETAVPAGTYTVTMALSPKFGKRLPLLHDVPGFTGILIHSGNKPADTWGCILVGQQTLGPAYIQGGSVAMPKLCQKIEDAIKRGEKVSIEINDAPVEA